MSEAIPITPEEAERLAKEELRKMKRAYMSVFNTPNGIEVLKHLSVRC